MMMKMMTKRLGVLVLTGLVPGILAAAVEPSLLALKRTGTEGEGGEEAAWRWKEVAGYGPERLVEILGTIDSATALGTNYLKSAADVVAERALAEGKELPVAALGSFLFDTSHSPRARQQAFDLIAKAEPETAAAMVPGFLNDPNTGLRRAAVGRLMEAAEGVESDGAKALLLQQALGAARDADQVRDIADDLKKLGREVDLPRHFGFLMRWKTIGPFDNRDGIGFSRVYPPEEGIDLEAEYPGKESQVVWQDFVTAQEMGMVDLNKAYTALKGVVGYAYAEFESDVARPAEVRLGCKNAWKVWVNGELLFGRDEYHRGMRVDQYKMPFQMKAGKNTVLLKLCQDEQEQRWTVEWQGQLRICDAAGTAILAKSRGATPEAGEATGAPKRRRPAR
ncbi:MAG: hypothetical protein P8J87_07995 [Verrucomicrobiales bacterium]|nr:hypothetical protein [Verrucomicrobiales bacterium]